MRALALCLLASLICSCASSVGMGGGSSSFVSTEVRNSSRASVNAAVKSVFREEGFTLIRETPNGLDFQKWGGRSSEIIYGSWLTNGVAIEPEIIISDNGSGNFGVHCDVYMREHNGSELLDANWKVRASGKGAYRNLMKKIKNRAEAP